MLSEIWQGDMACEIFTRQGFKADEAQKDTVTY